MTSPGATSTPDDVPAGAVVGGIVWWDADTDGELDADLASFVVRCHRSSRHAALFEGQHRAAMHNGAVQVERHLVLGSLDPATGQALRLDFFGVEQFTEAVRAYDALVARREREDVLFNSASMVGGAITWSARLSRWNRMRACPGGRCRGLTTGPAAGLR